MPKDKKQPEEETKKTEISIPTKKTPVSKRLQNKPTAIATAAPLDLWRAFDNVFVRFRSDFEDLLFPSYWGTALSLMPETRVPTVDLEDREKDYLLKAEMPGFKKEDIEIEAQDDSVVISARVGWKYDKKAQDYICRERACESFYRAIQLPQEINTEDVTGCLSDGVLELTLPKKAPKKKRKVTIK